MSNYLIERDIFMVIIMKEIKYLSVCEVRNKLKKICNKFLDNI